MVRKLNVSAMLRPAKTGDPGGDNAAQNRFTALRNFTVMACNASGTVTCANDADFHLAYTSAEDAFPATKPRPASAAINMRSFAIPATLATHLRLVVGGSQCSSYEGYAGQQSADPNVLTDCTTEFAMSGQVRIAEFEAFDETGPGLVGEVITADVTGAPLAMSIPGSNQVTMPATTLTGYDQIVHGVLNSVTVVDPRGTSAGWNLTGQVSDFVGPNGVILADNFGWTPAASAASGTLPVPAGQAPVVTAGPAAAAGLGTGLANTRSLCSGAVGHSAGAFQCGATLDLGIPGSTKVGTYTGVLTLTLV